jgi:hypothetical protein
LVALNLSLSWRSMLKRALCWPPQRQAGRQAPCCFSSPERPGLTAAPQEVDRKGQAAALALALSLSRNRGGGGVQCRTLISAELSFSGDDRCT